MAKQKSGQGAETGDLHTLVLGMEKLFQFLEAVKLDIANHQIRSFPYPSIDDTVAFQQDYFRSRIRHGELEIDEPRVWYWDALRKHRQCQVDSASTPNTSDGRVSSWNVRGLPLP
ncbi:uncharacterized protein PV07_12779 [Cladophialophora immunda]|uniref:Uncharacterized protein n=1 Tax=Cladophialophora immunda TaxID=569365 RepID=A0A0D1Z283_9EURO|nr:uncharacterized protein PV07_12779 [Cladophialophora immunda]KIW21791.1 hypothetical protein PV07_12779 [Cladophialophora immunda]